MKISAFQWRLAKLIAKSRNGAASTAELGHRVRTSRVAVYSAMLSLEKKGYACQFRTKPDRWAPLMWALCGELKKEIST